MSKRALKIVIAFAALALTLDGLVLGLLLLWLIEGRGYVTCGQAIMNQPDWPLAFAAFVGPPLAVFIGASIVIFLCSKKLLMLRRNASA